MAKPIVDTTTGNITFPNIMFNNINCFMRNMSKPLSEMQKNGSKNIPFKLMVIGTNNIVNLDIKIEPTPKYSNIELEKTVENPSYSMTGFERKEDEYGNATVYLMLKNGWNDNRMYDTKKNLMCSTLLGWTWPTS